MIAQSRCGITPSECVFVAVGLGATCVILLGVILCLVIELDWRTKNMAISKNIIGATYENPYQAPYASNDYSQNVAPPAVTGGGAPYVNPQSVVDEHFFSPATPNDDAFSDMQAPGEISDGSPIGQIMSDFKSAIEDMES